MNFDEASEMAKRLARYRSRVRPSPVIEGEFEVLLGRCPKCGHALPGMLTMDYWEACNNNKCDYQRPPTYFLN